MQIDFNKIELMTMPGMNNGTGKMSARTYNNDFYRIIQTAIHLGGSIGNHNSYIEEKYKICSRRFDSFSCVNEFFL